MSQTDQPDTMREEYSEPALSGIQVIQKDGTAVITVSKDNDDCDQVWTDIAVAREKRGHDQTNAIDVGALLTMLFSNWPFVSIL